MALRDKKSCLPDPYCFPSSVISKFWEDTYINDMDTSHLWPFQGKRQLPTKGQVLCIYFYFRGQNKFHRVSQSQIMDMVLEQVAKCWRLANIKAKTITNMKSNLIKLLGVRDNLVRNKNK